MRKDLEEKFSKAPDSNESPVDTATKGLLELADKPYDSEETKSDDSPVPPIDDKQTEEVSMRKGMKTRSFAAAVSPPEKTKEK